MNKYIIYLVLLFSFYSMSLEAQISKSPKYVINNIKGKAEIKRTSSSRWESAYNKLQVDGKDMLRVGKKLDLISGKYEKTIYKTEKDVSVDFAWNHPHPVVKKRPTDIVLKGLKGDSIGFCFITTEGDWRVGEYINSNDSFEAMVINHYQPDTLYAYIYWIFPDSFKRIDLSEKIKMEEKVCILYPGIDNIFEFKEVQRVPILQNSEIFICTSKEPKEKPLGEFIYISAFKEHMRDYLELEPTTIRLGIRK